MIDENLLIFGAGLHAQKLANALTNSGRRVIGFVISNTLSVTHIDEIPVYTWDSLPAHFFDKYQFACGIFNRSDSYSELEKIMHSHKIKNILWPWQYYEILYGELGWCYWLNENSASLLELKECSDYSRLYSALADQESKIILDRLIAFRTGADINFSSYNSNDHQYFNSLTLNSLPSNGPIRYLDLGAYTGDTLEDFLKHVEVSQAVLVEPEPTNLIKLTRRINSICINYPKLNPYILPVGAGSNFESVQLSGYGEASTPLQSNKTAKSSMQYNYCSY